LESGSGSGNSSLRLAGKVKNITLLDISSNALKCSKILANYYSVRNANFIKGDIFSIPFKDNYFDFSWSVGVVEHYTKKEIRKIICEMIRVTKSNGYICIGFPNFSSLAIKKAKLLSNIIFKKLTFINGYRIIDEKNYKENVIKNIIINASKEKKIKIENILLEYAGSVLPIETPKIIFKFINPISNKYFKNNSFLYLYIFKIIK